MKKVHDQSVQERGLPNRGKKVDNQTLKVVGRKTHNTCDYGSLYWSNNSKAKKDHDLRKELEVQVLNKNCTSLRIFEKEMPVDNFNTNFRSFKMGESSKLIINNDSKSYNIILLKRSKVRVLSEGVENSRYSWKNYKYQRRGNLWTRISRTTKRVYFKIVL